MITVEITSNGSKIQKAKWTKKACELLLSYVERNKKEVDLLTRTRSHEIKGKLWKNASDELRHRGYKYTSVQCSFKWKNIKKYCKVGGFFLFELKF